MKYQVDSSELINLLTIRNLNIPDQLIRIIYLALCYFAHLSYI